MTKQDAARFGRQVTRGRRNLGLALRALASRARVDHTWLYRLERGQFTDPDPASVGRVLDALQLVPSDRVARSLGELFPEMPTYFRAKYDLSPDQVVQVERYVRRLRGRH